MPDSGEHQRRKAKPMNTWVKKLPGVAIVLAVAVALAPVAPAYALGASEGKVNGYVRSAATGAVLSGVTVRVFDMGTAEFIAETRSGEDGAIDLSDLPFGLYQVSVVAPEGYASAAGPLVHLTADEATATTDFNLEPLPSAPAPISIGTIGPVAGTLLIGGITAIIIATIIIATGDEELPPTTG